MSLPSTLTGRSRSFAQSGPSHPPCSSPPEDRPLLAVQRPGARPAYVHVRPAGPLDGLYLVRHRQRGV